jgi:hypothetical protein
MKLGNVSTFLKFLYDEYEDMKGVLDSIGQNGVDGFARKSSGRWKLLYCSERDETYNNIDCLLFT